MDSRDGGKVDIVQWSYLFGQVIVLSLDCDLHALLHFRW